MSCNRCQCSPCSCTVEEIRVPAPQVRVIHMGGGGSSCGPIKGWYETLSVTSWPPPAAGESTVVAVADATQFPVGTCVALRDGAGNQRVLRVTGWNHARNAIFLLAYANAEAVGGTLSGNINIFPLALCPVETQVGGAVCDRDYMVTAEAFVMPTAESAGGGTVKLVFDTPQTLQLGMDIYVVGAGYMRIGVPPSGVFVACGTEFHAYNLGSNGNAGAGTIIAAGAAAYPDTVPVIPASDEDDPVVDPSIPNLHMAYGYSATTRYVQAAGNDGDLLVTLHDLKVDEVVEVYGEATVWQALMKAQFTMDATSTATASRIFGVGQDHDDGEGHVTEPWYGIVHKELWKVTADGSLAFRWRWDISSGPRTQCRFHLHRRNLLVRRLGKVTT